MSSPNFFDVFADHEALTPDERLAFKNEFRASEADGSTHTAEVCATIAKSIMLHETKQAEEIPTLEDFHWNVAVVSARISRFLDIRLKMGQEGWPPPAESEADLKMLTPEAFAAASQYVKGQRPSIGAANG